MIAIEIKDPIGYGRVRMRHMRDASGDRLIPFVCDVVSPGATVQTDGGGGYNELQKNGYISRRSKVF